MEMQKVTMMVWRYGAGVRREVMVCKELKEKAETSVWFESRFEHGRIRRARRISSQSHHV